MIVSFDVAAIIYLMALIEAWAIIIGGSLLLAFASIPWFAAMLPRWILSILSISVRVFALLAVLAIGLTEAEGWATAMTANSGSISRNISVMLQAITEALLFVACVYFIRRTLSNLVAGGAAAMCERSAAEAGVMLLPSIVFECGDSHVRLGFGRAGFAAGLAVFSEWLDRTYPVGACD